MTVSSFEAMESMREHLPNIHHGDLLATEVRPCTVVGFRPGAIYVSAEAWSDSYKSNRLL